MNKYEVIKPITKGEEILAKVGEILTVKGNDNRLGGIKWLVNKENKFICDIGSPLEKECCRIINESNKVDNDIIKCIGVRKDYRVYYNARHKEYFILTPNFRVSRYANHCADENIASWINNTIQKYDERL